MNSNAVITSINYANLIIDKLDKSIDSNFTKILISEFFGNKTLIIV